MTDWHFPHSKSFIPDRTGFMMSVLNIRMTTWIRYHGFSMYTSHGISQALTSSRFNPWMVNSVFHSRWNIHVEKYLKCALQTLCISRELSQIQGTQTEQETLFLFSLNISSFFCQSVQVFRHLWQAAHKNTSLDGWRAAKSPRMPLPWHDT